jgi:predicted nucleotidyltransferase
MGSVAYGVSDDNSDMDVYGWCIPPKDLIFPENWIPNFDNEPKWFHQFQEHHIDYKEKNYDLHIYSIVKYMKLCLENNPNMLDSMFVPHTCVLKISNIASMVREKRRDFLSKESFNKLRAYAFSQLHKCKTKNPKGKRKEIRDKFGTDVKFLYHVVRLLSQCQQILEHGDLDLQEPGRREHMKAIRRGEVSEEEVVAWFNSKERELDKIYSNSKLQLKPDKTKIKELLLNCLEHHYGSISEIERPDKYKNIVQQIKELVE